MIAFQLIEKYFSFLSLSFLIGNPIFLLLYGNLDTEGYKPDINNPEVTINLLIYGLSGLLLLKIWQRVLYVMTQQKVLIWILLILVLIVLLSCHWSSFPDLTWRRSLIFAGSTLYGVYFGIRYSFKQQIKYLTWAFGLIVLMSLFFIIALPQYGITQSIHAGAWRGIYAHKNGLGASMALCSTFFLVCLLGKAHQHWQTWAIFACSIILLIMSRSSTALSTFLSLPLFLLLYHTFRLRADRMFPVLLGGSLLATS